MTNRQLLEEILRNTEALLRGQDESSAKEHYEMTVNREQFREMLRKSTSIRGAIRSMVQALKDTKTEEDFQEMADEVIANNADYEALILENVKLPAPSGGSMDDINR